MAAASRGMIFRVVSLMGESGRERERAGEGGAKIGGDMPSVLTDQA